MSTFGKNALVWWDYHSNDRESMDRYHRTPKNLQIQILQKWYPIGMMVSIGDGIYNYMIVDHTQFLTFWHIEIKKMNNDGSLDPMHSHRHPLSLTPEPGQEKLIKRDNKLNRII